MTKKKVDTLELFQLIDEFGLDDLMTAVVKYIVGASGKNEEEQLDDLSKASRYLYKQVKDLERRNYQLQIQNLVLDGPHSFFCRGVRALKLYSRHGRYCVLTVSGLEARSGFTIGDLLPEGLEWDVDFPPKIEPSYDKSHAIYSIPVRGWAHQVDPDTIKALEVSPVESKELGGRSDTP